MGKHETSYPRMDREFYPTPAWVVGALAEHVALTDMTIWEPACGDGRMSKAIFDSGAAMTLCSDIEPQGMGDKFDFVSDDRSPFFDEFDGIITNPPYGPRGKLAEAFIESGLRRVPPRGILALLLPNDFDSAVTRSKWFGANPYFSAKICLTKRIKWFDRPVKCRVCDGTGRVSENVFACGSCQGTGGKTVGPKENHAWFIWERSARPSPPRLLYGPSRKVAQ